ncbi:MAG: UbiA-like polyprenyltransferase [Fimbriiglobus sp.]
MLARIQLWLSLIRFSHTVFALPFAFVAATLAWHRECLVRAWDVVGILACMVLARSAAMAFNRLVDRDIDGQNPRTRSRHIPAGLVSVPAVVLFTMLTSLGFIGSTMLFSLHEPPNYWPLYLSLPVLGVVLLYSLTKRFTSLAHFWLGMSLSLAPLAAWIAIRGIMSLEDFASPGCLALAVLFWVSGFDMLYACQDADYDRNAKLHSIPAKLGVRGALRLAAGCHAVMFGCLVAFGFVTPELGPIYFVGLVVVAGLLVYQHWLVKPDDLRRVNDAFFKVNAVISFGLLGLVLVNILVWRGG